MSSPGSNLIKLPRGRMVPESAIEMRADTSGGPGGQHANRSSTRIELRIHLAAIGLTGDERELVFTRLRGRITREGELVVWASDSRSQLQNRKLACRRAEQLLAQALAVEAKRVPTKPSAGARRRAREAKQHRSAQKQARSWRPDSDG